MEKLTSKCENCGKKLTKLRFDKYFYTRESNVYLCSLDCLTSYSHEYLGCVPLNKELMPILDSKDLI